MTTEALVSDCPVCRQTAREAPVTDRGWHRDCGWYEVRCETCGCYWIAELQLQSLQELTDEERAILSTLARRRDKDGYRLPLSDKNTADLIITYRIGLAAAAAFDWTCVAIGYAGGTEFGAPTYIVDADGKRFTLRIYDDALTYDEIRSELYWVELLRSHSPDCFPGPVAAPSGETIQQVTDPHSGQTRHCVLSNWVPGVTLVELAS